MALNDHVTALGRFIDQLPWRQFVRVELEIGSSRGDLLCELAEWHPHCLFIGVDIDALYCEQAVALSRARKLQNVVVVNREAFSFLSAEIPNEFLDTIHIYHPTPWNHVVERLLTPRFEHEAFRTLRPWGVLRLLTDDEQYYSASVRIFNAHRWWAVDWKRNEFALRRGALAGSPLELQYREQGARFYNIQLTRLPSK